MKNFTKRLAISTVAAGTLLATAFTPGAFAQAGDGTSAIVTGGDLVVTAVADGDFEGRAITGTAQTTTAALTFTVGDLRGSGDGWHVTAAASPFTGTGATPPVLPANHLSLAAGTVTPQTGVTSTAPGVSAGASIDVGAVQIASAALTQGMGTYDFAKTMTLSLPANVLADTYSSTVTIDAITAP